MGALKVGEFRRPRLMVFETGASFKIRDVEVQTFGVPHDAADPCGFTLTAGGVRFGFATDLGSITQDVALAMGGPDVVFIESNHDMDMLAAGPYPAALKRRVAGELGHLSNEAVAEWLKRGLVGTSRVILGQLSKTANDIDLVRLTATEALSRTSTRLQIAGDPSENWTGDNGLSALGSDG
jgi:phosphoribosyl 1,2-cyclic phosphodiesterase